MHLLFHSQRLCSLAQRSFLFALVLFACHAHAQTHTIPAETFFDHPNVSQVSLSPDGNHVAMLLLTKQGRVQLAAMALADSSAKIIGGFADVDIRRFHWVNNDRLVFDVHDRSIAVGATRFAQGLYAVNRDGSDFKQLVERVWGDAFSLGTTIKRRVLKAETRFYEIDHRKESDKVFVVEPTWDLADDLKSLRLYALDTKTNLTESFTSPGNVREWFIDANAVPRLVETVEEGVSKLLYRESKDGAWQEIQRHTLFQDAAFVPLELGPDGVLYVLARHDRDTTALHRYDLEKKEMESKPIVAVSGYDFDGDLIFDYKKKKLLGVTFLNDARATYWLDADMKEVQRRVDEKLAGTINIVRIGREGLGRFVMVESYSDTQPSVFSSFDRETANFKGMGSTFPKIDASQMAQQDMVRITAQDGLPIPAYLTLPQGKSKTNLPMIVLVHGGPYLRGSSWEWNAQVQFLASRGYAVLQPEFRGSAGFGFKHFQAGWKQWGRAMQEDIADAARWAIKTGVADPARICIAGASYGGYATLMGLAKHPELFRCGISWAAVTDIQLMYKADWMHDLSAEWQNYGMPRLIGDPVADAEQIRITSPINNADKIHQPLLLAHGRADRRVPIVHGESFYEAIKKTNSQVEWVTYLEEGHGWGLVSTRVDFWNKVERFLQQHLGKKN